MPLQDLPPDILIKIFGCNDNLRTVTKLSATCRYLRSVWSEHTTVILQDVTHNTLPCPGEANRLADRYEEIFHIRQTGDRATDAIRRAKLLADELQVVQNLVKGTSDEYGDLKSHKYRLPSAPCLDQASYFPKLAYKVVHLMVSFPRKEPLKGPISIPCRFFQDMQPGDLKMLRLVLIMIAPYCFYQSSVVFQSGRRSYHEAPEHFRAFVFHFKHSWPARNNTTLTNCFLWLQTFLVLLYMRLTIGPPPNGPDIEPEQYNMVDWRAQDPEGAELEDLLASASFCTLEGDRWVFDFSRVM